VTPQHILIGLGIFLLSLPSTAGFAASNPAILVLDFELNDLTPDPGNASELQRTASIGPLLRENLKNNYEFEVIDIDSDIQRAADKAFGYLYEHEDIAAELAREAASDWIIVGRLHKPSLLFAYLKARVIHVETEHLVAELSVEVKGSQERLTAKGVESLARQIAKIIDPARVPP
jgi:hypothetical protein